MKIALITGRLEAGSDGVGDYTRTLAQACLELGLDLRLLSVAETEVRAASATHDCPTLRLTKEQWLSDGGLAARRWLEEFGPDWASLQFVPYSFDPRGLFGPAIAPLAHLLAAAPRRHVFFHEIWIGSHQGASWKSRAYGFWQRHATRRLLRRLTPQCVHTSTGYYRDGLAAIGQPAKLLTMFGSVPRPATPPPVADWPGVPRDALVCGHFGTLHPGWEADAFLEDFHALAQKRRQPAALVAAGALKSGRDWFDGLAARWQGKVSFVALGRLSLAELAGAFARFDFAVSSVPWNIIGKSSSAAALREHGLHVLVTAAGSPARFKSDSGRAAVEDAGLVPYFQDRSLLARAPEKTVPAPGVKATAQRFWEDLRVAGSGLPEREPAGGKSR